MVSRIDTAVPTGSPAPPVDPANAADDRQPLTELGQLRDRASTRHTKASTPARSPRAGVSPNASTHGLTAYEREREERVRRNKELMRTLRVTEAKQALDESVRASAETNPKRSTKTKTKRERDAPAPEPTRRSARVRGESSRAKVEISEDDKPVGVDGELLYHLTCDEYCERLGIEPGPKMSGGFRGWVEESVREALGIAASADEAWERNGGGKSDRRPGKGEAARDHAKRMLYKNPNAYFYRHTAGEEQKNGDWDEEEIALFVEVAKKHGCGDKWGLFASHIPGRVGYQCSAAYRHVIIPRGLLRDDAWRMTLSGEAVWVGRR